MAPICCIFEVEISVITLCYTYQVLSAGDDAVGLEQLEEDADDIALHKARRFMGTMSAMSGANGMVYMEYRYIASLSLFFARADDYSNSFSFLSGFIWQCILNFGSC